MLMKQIVTSVMLSVLAMTMVPSGTLGQGKNNGHDKELQNLLRRGDISNLPSPLKARLAQLIEQPHSAVPTTAFNEAANPSLLFQYYLVDQTGFQPNAFTSNIPGINDSASPPAQGALGAVRVVLEPKPGKPLDPNDVHAAIDTFADFSGLNVINNESGWYENWMFHDLVVANIAPPRSDGSTAAFGTITTKDALALRAMGSGNNVPGRIFTTDGDTPRTPAATDHFPDVQTNLVSFAVSVGTFNALQLNDAHAYWEFNPGTDWVFPAYELPFTGGIPGSFQNGQVGALSSVVPGSGPAGIKNNPVQFGDDPDNPRDPDRNQSDNPAQNETRLRFIPSGLANEVFLDVYERVASFEPGVGFPQRLFDAYAKEVARVDKNGDGVISFEEANVDGTSDGLPNTRLYLAATAFNRFVVTREINDGLLAPRFAPSQRGYLLSGVLVSVKPAVNASIAPGDGDNDGDDGN
jgi:hypothetical protein